MHKMRLAALFLATAAMLSAGCSAIKLGYETLPTWSFFQLDRYWKLDSTQSELVRARLNEFQQWHRRAELPQYARFLEGVRDRVRGQIDAAEIARWREAAEARWKKLAHEAAPRLADVALTLKPEQIERMKKRLADQNEDYRKKIFPKDPKDRQENRIERVEERAEFFLGRLTDTQQDAVRKHAAAVTEADEAMYAERVARQQAVVALLARIASAHPSREEAQRQIEAALVQLWEPRDAQRAAVLDRSAAATDQLTVALVNSATPAQKKKMAERLQTWSMDFEILTGR